MTLKSAVQPTPIGKPLDGMILIFVALFAVFLLFAAIGQLLNWNWRAWFPGAEGAQSMLGGVKSAVYTAISHLN